MRLPTFLQKEEPAMPDQADDILPPPPPDPEQEAAMTAAANLVRARRQRDGLEEMLMKANLGLEAKNHEINRLENALEEERHRSANYQHERDHAIEEKAALLSFFANNMVDLENMLTKYRRYELPAIKRKRNGPVKPLNDLPAATSIPETAVSYTRPSQEPMAEQSPILEDRKSVLDQ